MPSVVAVIPARAGSKGVPAKNVRELGGHPLLAWSIAACKKTCLINRVIVSTDSRAYADLAINYGAEAPFLRPPEISGDNSTDYEFIVHALDWLDAHLASADFVVHIRPTTPLRRPALIDEAIYRFMNAPEATAIRSVHEMPESAYKAFELSSGGHLQRLASHSTELDAANNARQQFPATFQANGYVDVLSTQFIRQSGLIHGDRVIPFVTPYVVEVDSIDDFELLEFQVSRQPSVLHQLFD